MKKFAQIIDDKVHWIFEAEEKPEFASYIILVEITGRDNIKEGWNYDKDNNIFSESAPKIDIIKANKINEMNSACQNAIINTFKSSAYDGATVEDYACEITDQSRINGLVTIAQLRLANLTTEHINYYKNKEAIKCTEWQPKNMLNLGLDLKRHIEKNTNRYEDLKIYINSLTTVEEVQKVTWETVIPTTT